MKPELTTNKTSIPILANVLGWSIGIPLSILIGLAHEAFRWNWLRLTLCSAGIIGFPIFFNVLLLRARVNRKTLAFFIVLTTILGLILAAPIIFLSIWIDSEASTEGMGICWGMSGTVIGYASGALSAIIIRWEE